MQLTTIAVFFSLAAFGAAQLSTVTTGPPQSVPACVPGKYHCLPDHGKDAIYVCSNGKLVFAASCDNGRCVVQNQVPHCIG
ncbi:hypothetical protein C7999DRAFT_15261 [Corynascus novoguineensis]|uniref:Uncharacterized protein n=1 Tax=Corynascus novoguineensis TaxID=1126955 RepID=A0AAN7CRM6_9PEZI|nr:hypothetical protein C7999DRAFT_15261 [Corynascus novoguineensis]